MAQRDERGARLEDEIAPGWVDEEGHDCRRFGDWRTRRLGDVDPAAEAGRVAAEGAVGEHQRAEVGDAAAAAAAAIRPSCR